jgi:hypothetical protein
VPTRRPADGADEEVRGEDLSGLTVDGRAPAWPIRVLDDEERRPFGFGLDVD